ncbi:MAG: alanyl-tRNA editing protein [Pseudomonas sp.]
MLAINWKTLALFDDAPYQSSFSARVVALGELGVALDQTLFYPTGGGQPGDVGAFFLEDGSAIPIVGTQRDPQQRGLIWHRLEGDPPPLSPGLGLKGSIAWGRRYQHMKMHTCLHLLCSLIDAPVTGCSIGDEKGRLDFDLPEMSLDKEAITQALNELIRSGIEVKTRRMPAADYAAVLGLTRTQAAAPPVFEGAVRVIEIAGVDVQPCGGTHVRNTAEIGRVVCDRIEKKSKHNRRVVLRFAEA